MIFLFCDKARSFRSFLKALFMPEDARKALDAGVDGIIVSNHGGRQTDGSIATLDALPKIVEVVQNRIPVLLDSGSSGWRRCCESIGAGGETLFALADRMCTDWRSEASRVCTK
jgi:hypothetical protein